ncbi:MAG: hypothetical protein HYX68_14330 [Planctomycetes bacterium]|nr:hypothetical protein [Planctomycetota bacterium]
MPKELKEETDLLAQIAANMPALEELLENCNDHWGYEDPIYRFYHQSFKVFWLQGQTERIVAQLQALAPTRPLNATFIEIIKAGTGKSFKNEANATWTQTTRAILEAFFHARFFLEMVCRYGKDLKSPPQELPSGWAAVLYLYGLR